jgi:hypothetical protein
MVYVVKYGYASESKPLGYSRSISMEVFTSIRVHDICKTYLAIQTAKHITSYYALTAAASIYLKTDM